LLKERRGCGGLRIRELVPVCRQDLMAMCLEHGQQIRKLAQAVAACNDTGLQSILTIRLNRAVCGKVFVAFAVATTTDGSAAFATFGWFLYGYMTAIDPKIEQIFLNGITQIRPRLSRKLAVFIRR
jgi:hypothetical protein